MKHLALILTLVLSSNPSLFGAATVSFDLIDHFFETDASATNGDLTTLGGASSHVAGPDYDDETANGQQTSMTFDLIDYNDGTPIFGSDGFDDIQIITSTAGLGLGGGNYSDEIYAASMDASTTGLRSTLTNGQNAGGVPSSNPVPTIGTVGTAGATFEGLNTLTQTIEIRFLDTLIIEWQDLLDVAWNSSNTANTRSDTNAFEWSAIQLLDQDNTAFSSIPIVSYVEDRTSAGWIGVGTKIANGDTQDGVGTSDAITNDPANSFRDDTLDVNGASQLGDSGLTATTRIGGIRFTHNIIDNRGTSDSGGFEYTATIADIEISGAQAVPEPNVFFLLSVVSAGVAGRTWLRTQFRTRPKQLDATDQESVGVEPSEPSGS